MSGLRDARLRKALEAAPDDGLRPSRATRDAILARAHGAVQRQQPASWWQRWKFGDSASRRPWNAAFATFAVATLVTVVWHDREVPGSKVDSEQPAAVVRAPTPAPVPTPETAAPKPEVAAAPASKAPAPQDAQRQRATPAAAAQPRSLPLPVEPPPALQAEARGAAPDAAVGQAQDSLRRSAAESSGTAAMRDQAQRSELAKAAPAAPPPMAAPAPVARMSPQLVAVAGANMSLRMVRGTQVSDIPLAQRRRLADLVNRVAGSARGSEPLEALVDTQVELFREGQPAGVLELAGPQVRWRSGTDAGTSRPDPALLQALRDELAR